MKSGVPLLSVQLVSKRFPGVHALKAVSFDCKAGEVLGLVGENGAGKSTLMRILAGAEQPDAGRLCLYGEPMQLTSPAAAHLVGIHMVWQDTRLVPNLDVTQNIWLGNEPGGPFFVDRRRMDRESEALLARLGLTLEPKRKVAALNAAERQRVEIARALAADVRVLVLDEPTTALNFDDVRQLMRLMHELASDGAALIFSSHRLHEIFEICDRITVLKDGQVVSTDPARDLTEDEVVRRMVGREVTTVFPPRASVPGTALLAVDELLAPGRFGPVSFTALGGEILGIGGIQGNGQHDIVRAFFGLERTSGLICVGGHPVTLSSPAAAIAAGVVYVPGNRRVEGLFLPHSIRENLILPHLVRFTRRGFVATRAERAQVLASIAEFGIRTPTPEQAVALLSGGNQQKAVLARWSLAAPRVIVLEEPTQGVDVATKSQIYHILRALAEGGAAIILLTSDLVELIGLSDRIVVISGGCIVDRFDANVASEERVIGSAVRARLDKIQVWTPRRGICRAALLTERYAVPASLLALVLALGGLTMALSPYFLTERNLSDVGIQLVPLAIAALGQMVVILQGGVDLSVGPVMSMTTGIASWLITGGGVWLTIGGISACIAAGTLVGGVNAAMIRILRIPDLIATLASYSAVLGVALIVRPSPGGMISERFIDFLTGNMGPVPVALVAVLAAYGVAEILLLRGRVGVALYAAGASPEAAFAAGVPIGRLRFLSYIGCGICSALAGLVLAARIGGGDPQSGASFTLASITAVVVGGTSIFGGIGTAVGTLLGAVLILILQNMLNQIHVTAYWQYVWTGLVTLGAVALSGLRARQRAVG